MTVTKHQREIIQAYVDISNREKAAKQLKISPHTLKNWIHILTGKFGAVNKTDLAVKAFCAGLIQ